jgi:REP element-mobilizing transposase RayT
LTADERQIVLDACIHWHGSRASVPLALVMPDHVHLFVRPLPDPAGGWFSLSRLMHSIKSFSAHEVLRGRGQAGPLWQQESYDRIVRDAQEYENEWEYTRQNPVRKGLSNSPDDYAFLRAPKWSAAQRAEVERTYLASAPLPHGHRPEAYATDTVATSRGTFEGRIGLPPDVPRGDNGFGYDPLFLLPAPDARTSAELPAEEKNARSHRGAAARDMAHQIKSLAS